MCPCAAWVGLLSSVCLRGELVTFFRLCALFSSDAQRASEHIIGRGHADQTWLSLPVLEKPHYMRLQNQFFSETLRLCFDPIRQVNDATPSNGTSLTINK